MSPDRSAIRLPTSRPRLPAAREIAPFLDEIDRVGWYTNFGPLVQRLEARLADHFKAEPGSVVTVSNATMGLSIALRGGLAESVDRDRPSLCAMPSWTFVATAMSALNTGLSPYFLDVDADLWSLTPDRVRRAIVAAPAPVRAILPVAPFGAPLDIEAWAALARTTGLPVVIDAAAGFDTARSDPAIVSVVSLSATKVIGCGEGGFILAGTRKRAERLRRISNFGFDPTRTAIYDGINGKMSEYAAAVALAALDSWPDKRRRLMRTADAYIERLGALNSIAIAPTFSRRFASTTANIAVPRGEADAVIAWLNADGLEARRWWNRGCHAHPVLRHLPRDGLETTLGLADQVVGLPFWDDMSDDDMDLVVDRLHAFAKCPSGIAFRSAR